MKEVKILEVDIGLMGVLTLNVEVDGVNYSGFLIKD